MDSLVQLMASAQNYVIIAMVALFTGIVAFVFWPGTKNRMEAPGRIPLNDDDSVSPGR